MPTDDHIAEDLLPEEEPPTPVGEPSHPPSQYGDFDYSDADAASSEAEDVMAVFESFNDEGEYDPDADSAVGVVHGNDSTMLEEGYDELNFEVDVVDGVGDRELRYQADVIEQAEDGHRCAEEGELSDDQLYERAEDADDLRGADEWTKIRKGLFAYCRGNGLREADAEDLADESIFKAVRNLKKTGESVFDKPRAWFLAILRNEMKQLFRKRKPVVMETVPEEDERAVNTRQTQELGRMTRDDLLDNLREGIGRLKAGDERYIEAFCLHYLDGLTLKQAGIDLGLNYNNVKYWARKLRSMLRNDINPDGGPAPAIP